MSTVGRTTTWKAARAAAVLGLAFASVAAAGDLAGLFEPPEGKAIFVAQAVGKPPQSYQGRDLTPLVYGRQPQSWRTDFFCEHLFDRHDIPKYEGVRGERYVYARYFENLPEGEFLHDLQTDPLELKNLVGDPKYAVKVRELAQRIRTWQRLTNDELKLPKMRYDKA